jgi:ketosteroid isomerase-like protein
MSQDRIDLLRDFYTRLEGGVVVFDEVDFLDPKIDFEFAWMSGRGPDAFRKAVSDWGGTFEEWDIEAREFIDDAGPDQVIAIVRDRGRLKGAEGEIHNEFVHLWTFRDDVAVRFEGFTNKADALEAAGL